MFLRVTVSASALFLLCAMGATGVWAQQFDLLIVNGHIVEGTGNAWFPVDVGVKDGMIAKIGNLSGATAARTIDATGHVVSPGFIDIHNHSDRPALTNPRAENYIRQGVTTICIGNCGKSVVPSREYPTFTKYFGQIERQGISINLVALIGHGNLREFVMGPVWAMIITPAGAGSSRSRETFG